MPDLLEPADPRGGSRAVSEAVIAAPPLLPRPRPELQPPLPALLTFERVTKWYGPVIGVNQVTLELRPGITGLVGGNGAGKSTLMRLATGHMRPDIGSVAVCGRDAWSADAKRHVGYCPDLDAFYEEMSGRQFVEAMARLNGYPRVEARRRTEETLSLVGMADRAERRIRGYSKGMRQRVKLAQALIHDPEVLVLDEPLSGIDPIGRHESVTLFRRLAERGKCLLISSHELEELEKLTDHIAIMARGRIAAVGSVAQIRALLDDHPHAVRVDSDRPRELAGLLLRLPDVLGVEITSDATLIVRARNPRSFFAEFTRVVLEEDIRVDRLETLDASTHAVLGYLLGGVS